MSLQWDVKMCRLLIENKLKTVRAMLEGGRGTEERKIYLQAQRDVLEELLARIPEAGKDPLSQALNEGKGEYKP